MLDNGAQIDSRDIDCRTPLWLAALRGHLEVIDLIIDRDVSAHNSDNSPVCAAAGERREDTVMMFTRYGANLKHLQGKCMDHLGCIVLSREVEEMLQLLLSSGSRVNHATRGMNQSALMMAVHRGRIDIVNALLKHGADMYDSK